MTKLRSVIRHSLGHSNQEAEIGAERRAYSQIVIVFPALLSLPEIFSASLLFCFLYLFFAFVTFSYRI